jgi:synaptobrevin family protein YKT6
MEKSQDVSKLSLDFYKNAKKANKRCCSLYWFDFILK